MQKPYLAPAPNATAVRVARSWLRAVGVDATISGVAGCDLSVACADGGRLEVAASLEGDALPEADCLVIDARELASSDAERALAAFHVVTRAIGAGTPTPVDRGPAPEKRPYGNDFFLTTARHTEFRNAPDLTLATRQQYAHVVSTAAHVFFSRNVRLCHLHGYEVDDLLTYAWLWATNFAHRHAPVKETNRHGNDTERLLTKHLRDRFTELARNLFRVGRSTFPEADVIELTAPIADEAQEEREDEESGPSRDRRRAAKVALELRLSALPHDEHVAKLLAEANNAHREDAIRHAARHLLRKHEAACCHCQQAKISA